MTRPWNDWYHCNGNTYGTWVQGDERGYRERHHRKHVEGDYKNPPPSERDKGLRDCPTSLLVHPPTYLTEVQACVAGELMVQRLLNAEIELLSFVLDDRHFHMVGRFPDHRPRYYIGLAKQKASYVLVRQFGLIAPVWGKRCRCLPIEDREHQIAAVKYDLEHVKKGAFFLWSFQEGVVLKATA